MSISRLQNQLMNIARLQAEDLNTRLANKNITLHMSDAALVHAVASAIAASGKIGRAAQWGG